MNITEIINYVETVLIDLPSEIVALIPTLVQRGQAKIEDDHGFRIMEQTVEYPTVGRILNPDGTVFQVPERVLGPKPVRFARVYDTPVVRDGWGKDWPIDWIEREHDISTRYDVADPLDLGPPRHILDDGDGFEVFPLPDGLAPPGRLPLVPPGALEADGEYRIRIPYLQRQLTLQPSVVDTNWFSANADEYLIDYAAAEGFLLNRNSMEWQKWNAKAVLEKHRVIWQDKRSRLPRNLRLRPSPEILRKDARRF